MLVSGDISQQMSKRADRPGQRGSFIRLAPTALDMFVRYYAPKEDRP